MESTAGPSRSEATPEEQPNNQVVIDKADLEELIGNVVRREIAKHPGISTTMGDGGAYAGVGVVVGYLPLFGSVWTGVSGLPR